MQYGGLTRIQRVFRIAKAGTNIGKRTDFSIGSSEAKEVYTNSPLV